MSFIPQSDKGRKIAKIDVVLNKVLRDLSLDKRLREHTLMNLWPLVIGDFFAKRSRPLFIDSSNILVVSVADASTGQELTLHKREIMAKLSNAAQGLNMSVSGVRFDLKHFHASKKEELALQTSNQKALPEPTNEDLAKIDLGPEELALVEQTRIKIAQETLEASTTPQQTGLYDRTLWSDRLLKLFEQELRLKIWRRAHGYPICSTCGTPTIRPFPDNSSPGLLLCAPCHFDSQES